MKIIALLLVALLPVFSHAQQYPSRAITLVVPFAPGVSAQLAREPEGWRRVVREGGLKID